jgi:hypothetical protein
MTYGRSAELWLLFVYVGLGFGVTLWTLARQQLRVAPAQVVRVSLEVGVPAGVIWWAVIAWLGFSFGGGIFAVGINLAIRVVLWGVPAGLLAAWRLDRTLGLPFYRSSEITTPLCGTMVLLFLLVSAGHYLATAL